MGGVFGGRAVEISNIVVSPSSASQGLGSLMARKYMDSVEQELITAHTRSLRFLRMLERVCGDKRKVYPLRSEFFSGGLCGKPSPYYPYALEIPETTTRPVYQAYHVNHYDEGGLYGQQDPADEVLYPGVTIEMRMSEDLVFPPRTLKDEFYGLQDPRAALVVVAGYERS